MHTTLLGMNLVSAFLSYPVDVAFEMKQAEEVEFPAVTVCNVNAAKKSGWSEVDRRGESKGY